MKITVALFCSFVAIQMVAGQTTTLCGEKLQAMKTCMQELHQAKKESKPEVDKEKLKTDIKSCFTSNSCKDPNPDDDDEEGLSSKMAERILKKMEKFGFKFTEVTDENLAKFVESAKECGKQAKDTIKPDVETCVKGKDTQLTDFAFPELPEEEDDDEESSDPREGLKMLMKFMKGKRGGHHGGGKHGGGHGKMMKHAKRLVEAVYNESICAAENRDAARECIENAIDNIIPEEMKCKNPVQMMFTKVEKHKEFCDGRKKCLEDLGDDCADVKERIPGYVCECVAIEFEAKLDTLLDQFKTCINGQSGITIEEPGNLFKRAMGRFGKGAMQGMCEREGRMKRFDPCDPESQGKWGHRRGHGGPSEEDGEERGPGRGRGKGRGWGKGGRWGRKH